MTPSDGIFKVGATGGAGCNGNRKEVRYFTDFSKSDSACLLYQKLVIVLPICPMVCKISGCLAPLKKTNDAHCIDSNAVKV